MTPIAIIQGTPTWVWVLLAFLLYRGIKAKRFPLPVRVGPNTSRWLRSECHAARQKLIEARRPEPEGVGVASD